MTAKPLISVLLPLYNGADDIGRSLASVLAQTCGDFEVIVIDDGSKDDGAAVVSTVADPRIRLVRQENHGLAATLNVAIALANGRYLARQDQDDLSSPDRFAKQVAYLEANPAVALLGTRAEIWVGDQPSGRYHDHPADHAALSFELLFNNPFVHSSVMMRADAVQAVGGYTRGQVEDYELWSRLARSYQVANLPERLVVYREVEQSICRTSNPQRWIERVVGICAANLAAITGRTGTDAVVTTTAALHHGARHLMVSTVRFAQIEAVVRAAAAVILARAPQSDVAQRRDRVLWRLRRNWLEYRFGWIPGFQAVRSLVARARR